MSAPGFGAEAAIYRSRVSYQGVCASCGAAASGAAAALLTPAACTRTCFSCEGDFNSPTGCSQDCITGKCEEVTQVCSGCADRCEGHELCSNGCKDTGTDSKNCGACGHVCPPGMPCNNGTCGCLAGQTSCNGICTFTSADPANCGACGHACGAGQICQDGTCVASNCRVFCTLWNHCNETCGPWPPGFSNAGCWLDCLSPSVNCLISTCGEPPVPLQH